MRKSKVLIIIIAVIGIVISGIGVVIQYLDDMNYTQENDRQLHVVAEANQEPVIEGVDASIRIDEAELYQGEETFKVIKGYEVAKVTMTLTNKSAMDVDWSLEQGDLRFRTREGERLEVLGTNRHEYRPDDLRTESKTVYLPTGKSATVEVFVEVVKNAKFMQVEYSEYGENIQSYTVDLELN